MKLSFDYNKIVKYLIYLINIKDHTINIFFMVPIIHEVTNMSLSIHN